MSQAENICPAVSVQPAYSKPNIADSNAWPASNLQIT
jgi:hypothetical protein